MPFAITLDIGTTNIQSFLTDSFSKKQVDYLTVKNSQIFYGEDVISRLGLSLRNKTNEEKIRKSVINDLTLLVSLILKRNNLTFDFVDKVIACGNSAMQHILLGLPLSGLATAPFCPVNARKTIYTTLKDVGVSNGTTKKHIPFIFLPNIGGFVGSDALCVIFETEIYKSKRNVLAIDLGTNGEIILGNEKRILVASTSAGPAFESWHIKCGVYGSTMTDVMHDLLEGGIVDETGCMKDESTKFNINGQAIIVTRKDIRAFQLAKAAISTGINLLRQYFEDKEIHKVYLTGVFGAKINKKSARHAGLLPDDVGLDKIEVRQNAALLGATKFLSVKDLRRHIESILKIVEHIELHKEPRFQETFASSIRF